MKLLKPMVLILCTVMLVGCASSQKQTDFAAPLPPQSDGYVYAAPESIIATIETSSGFAMAHNETKEKSCRFSSFHRKNAIGYEIDPSRHISFSAAPKFDIFNPTDIDFKIGFNFTKSFGGPANKRPDCTYGSGYYGFIPFLVNDTANITNVVSSDSIKSLVQERIEAREIRRKQKEAEKGVGL